MQFAKLPVSALPFWCKLNDVSFLDTAVKDLGATRGFGLIAERALNSVETFDTPTLVLIPRDLVLSAEMIEEHSKVDHYFKELLDTAGGKSFRGDVLLFLLMQVTITSPDVSHSIGVSNPWTEFVKMLPSEVPVPTLWTEQERVFLVGTSLESALTAKTSALLREFEILREKTEGIAWCSSCWWEDETLELKDWVLLDALYRSRCLELPSSGESMVPGLDMANHSSKANTFYEQTDKNGVSLLLKPGVTVEAGSELTISYGESKSEAELLFSYGFIDQDSTTCQVVLSLEPMPDDPLGRAKLAAFSDAPIVRIAKTVAGDIEWESPFLALLCLNEEDGLDFKLLQKTDGSRDLRVFWQENDVTDKTTTFEALMDGHELKDVFKLRVVALLQDRIRQQIERLYESEETVQSLIALSRNNSSRQDAALRLRKTETELLEAAFTTVDDQKNMLMDSDVVMSYLTAMNTEVESELPERYEASDGEEDFS